MSKFKKLPKVNPPNSVDNIMMDMATVNNNQSNNQERLSKFTNNDNKSIIMATQEMQDMQDHNSYIRRIAPHDIDKLKSNQEIAQSLVCNVSKTDGITDCKVYDKKENNSNTIERDTIIKNAKSKRQSDKTIELTKEQENDIEDLTYGY